MRKSNMNNTKFLTTSPSLGFENTLPESAFDLAEDLDLTGYFFLTTLFFLAILYLRNLYL